MRQMSKGELIMKDYLNYKGKVCVVTGASSGIGNATCKMLVDLGAIVYGIDRNPCEIGGLTQFIQCDLSDKHSIDQAFTSLPNHIDSFFGVAGLSGGRTGYWTTFTVNFIANKYITDTYLANKMSCGGSIAYVTSCGGLMWEKWKKEYVKIRKAKTWDDMVKFRKKVSPKDGAGIRA